MPEKGRWREPLGERPELFGATKKDGDDRFAKTTRPASMTQA
jgi:hypothetical protein